MQKIPIEEAIERIIKNDPRYPRDAYYFVRESLDFTIKHAAKSTRGGERHVSGKDILEGLRLYALQQYGPMAYTVLNYWNLRQCNDVGDIVYNMVAMNILKTAEKDSRDDFRGGYDFEEAFQKPFEAALKRSRHPSSRSAKMGTTTSP